MSCAALSTPAFSTSAFSTPAFYAPPSGAESRPKTVLVHMKRRPQAQTPVVAGKLLTHYWEIAQEKITYFPDRGSIRTLRTLFVYIKGDAPGALGQ